MKSSAIKHPLAGVLLLLVCCTALADTTYVKFGATWKYRDNGVAAPTGSGAADWRNIAFNDAAWGSGLAEFGFGDDRQRTTTSFGPNPSNKYTTTYFRKVMNIPDISIFSAIVLNAYIDDGAVIYVNGVEVARTNMPAGTPAYSTFASSAAAENGNAITTFSIANTAFVSGNNIIAVEVHQNNLTSSDLTFDLEVVARTGSIFGFGSAWKYLDDGSNQSTAWRAAAFADASWKSGLGRFGFGDPVSTIVYSGCPPSNYPATEDPDPTCTTKFITTYFRKTFSLTGLASYTSFTMNVYRDDGIAIYVNGVEVARNLLPAVAAFNTPATAAASDDGQTVTTFAIPKTNFVEGSNTIAVEIHQNAGSSSDLTFDMQLIGNPAVAPEPDITRGPLLQMVTGNSIVIKWTTSTANSSRIKWGTGEDALTNTISNNTAVTEHEMTINGLTPDTKYYYAIGSASSIMKGSYRNYFTTAPPATTKRKIRIGVFGDAGRGDNIQKGSRDAYLTLKKGYDNSELAIMLGDNAYENGTQAEHTTKFFNIYNNNLFDNHVVFPVPGNHEYENNGARAVDHNIPYYSIFTVPDNGQSGGLPSGTEHYYSFNYGNIHFIMLDSYGVDDGKHLYDDTTAATGSQQALWLKADLAANAGTRKWTIVCLHHPPYTNGSHRSDNTSGEGDLQGIRQKIVPILERYGVDLVLAGHSHVYERSFLVKDHTGLSTPFNTPATGAGTKISSSNARYDGSVPSNVASADTSAANSSCPYFTIDSVYKHGTVYVVAGSAGQIGSGSGNTYPIFYTRNQSTSNGGESGSLYLEVTDNRLDAKFVGNSGTIRDQFSIMKGVNKKTTINTLVNTPSALTASWVGSYNWYTTPFPPVSVTSTARTLTFTPGSPGTYTLYVNDSITPRVTCIADTFTLLVTSPLAVSIIKYDALLKANKVLVQWTTSQEMNSDYFTIERSANGRDYETIMVMNGKGNSATPTNYEFIDNTPLEGTGYYRLTAVDLNGDRKVAGIRTVTYKLNRTFTISVKPNPAVNNQIQSVIQSTRSQILKVKLYDIRGAEVYSASLQANAGNNPVKISVRPGSYVMSIEAQDGSKLNEKVVVNSQ